MLPAQTDDNWGSTALPAPTSKGPRSFCLQLWVSSQCESSRSILPSEQKSLDIWWACNTNCDWNSNFVKSNPSTYANFYARLRPPGEEQTVKQESCLFNVGLNVIAIHFQNKKPSLSLHPQMQFVALGPTTHNGWLCPGKIIANRQCTKGTMRPTRRVRATQ